LISFVFWWLLWIICQWLWLNVNSWFSFTFNLHEGKSLGEQIITQALGLLLKRKLRRTICLCVVIVIMVRYQGPVTSVSTLYVTTLLWLDVFFVRWTISLLLLFIALPLILIESNFILILLRYIQWDPDTDNSCWLFNQFI